MRPDWRLAGLIAIFLGLSPLARAGTMPSGNAQDFRQIIESAKDKVFPSVIFLMPITERYEQGKKEKAQVAGSGVILSAQGHAVTNWHVVDKAVSIRCLLLNGEIGTATILGTDKDTDLALLQLHFDNRTEYPFATLGDSDKVQEGEFAMAMGAPWGLSRSVSLGIISCTTRFLSSEIGMYNLWIQTDASINPGNSGGPLVNTNGQVIGINTRGTFFGGDLAFAIPSNVVKRIVNALEEHGTVPRAWTGIRLQPLKDFERNIFYEGNEGVLVASVDSGSPAEKAGIQIGDLLLSIQNTACNAINRESIPAINQMLAELAFDKPAAITLQRNGKKISLQLTPRQKGKVEGDDLECKRWNMTVKAINEFSTPVLAYFKKTGIYVQGVKYPGNAANAGIQQNDILLSVDGKEVHTLEELSKLYESILKDSAREKKLHLVVERSGLPYHIALDYATEYENQ